jgi:hypothetical protein
MPREFTDTSPVKQISAWLPFVLSLVALGLILENWVIFGINHESDKGTSAQIFQVLMAVQVPVIGYFVLIWLPRQRKKTLRIFAFQATTWLAAIAAVYWLT